MGLSSSHSVRTMGLPLRMDGVEDVISVGGVATKEFYQAGAPLETVVAEGGVKGNSTMIF